MHQRRLLSLGLVALVLMLPGCDTPIRKWPSLPLATPGKSKTIDVRILDIDRCPKHDAELLEEKVEITASHISWHPAYYRAQNELFPLSYRDITDKDADFALVRYCPKCRAAQDEWGRTFDPMEIYREAIEDAKVREESKQDRVDE